MFKELLDFLEHGQTEKVNFWSFSGSVPNCNNPVFNFKYQNTIFIKYVNAIEIEREN